jgi:hypothetical protein
MIARSLEGSMLRLAVVVLLVSGCVGAVTAQQQQVRGQVINRDGAPQQCQVNFYVASKHYYGLTTDYKGYFVLTGPEQTTYRVEVVQGNRRQEFPTVIIDSNGMRPPTLVVSW